jgi:hypothetical protein
LEESEGYLKGRKSLRLPRGGEASRLLEDSAPTSEHVEGESGEVVSDEDDIVGDVPLIDTQSQYVEARPAGVERLDSVHADEGIVDL